MVLASEVFLYSFIWEHKRVLLYLLMSLVLLPPVWCSQEFQKSGESLARARLETQK